MRTKKETVEQEKNRNSQKSVKSVRLMGMGVYGGKDFWKRYVKDINNKRIASNTQRVNTASKKFTNKHPQSLKMALEFLSSFRNFCLIAPF